MDHLEELQKVDIWTEADALRRENAELKQLLSETCSFIDYECAWHWQSIRLLASRKWWKANKPTNRRRAAALRRLHGKR